jgi:acyl-CoA synthetase (AMP-forming)/AMP-acid ligase II
MSFAEFLIDVARQHPERFAVTDARQRWTYAEFAGRVSALGSAFRARGCRPADRVVLWMENCAEFLESLYGCWAAGLCAVPVNGKLHPLEVAHILSDSGASLLLTTVGLAEAAARAAESTGCPVICAGDDAYRAMLAADPAAPVACGPDDLAWIFYTSGTTGRPKGAMLTHRNLLGMSLRYLSDVDLVTPDDVHLHAAPLSHGSGLYGLPFFLKGAQHVVLPGFDPYEVAAVFSSHARVSMFTAPTMLTRLVNSPAGQGIEPSRIQTIYYGGGPMYVADLERALALFGPRLYQLYGQGESPMTITGLSKQLHAGTDGPPLAERLASCGSPRTGVRVRVVDEEDRDLPMGEIGEVITQSDCVMAGYWGNPDATAATLRGGWLHTGDLGSLDEQGYLTLRDRSKDMIISGGANIYPREVEEVLLRHPAVSEVSVIGRPHSEWGEEVVAFVVTAAGRTLAETELDELCLANIARFKRPKRYVFLESLPKNNYGKVLKTELRRLGAP